MKEIPLTKGKIAFVSDEDYELVSEYKWHITYDGYAGTNVGHGRGNRTILRMHRLITGAKTGDYVDHIDGNKLKNTRDNLRVCSNSENLRNRGKQSNNKTGYKGVSWSNDRNKYESKICKNGKSYFLGYFDCPKEAGLAYNKKALELYGEFAKLNVIE